MEKTDDEMLAELFGERIEQQDLDDVRRSLSE